MRKMVDFRCWGLTPPPHCLLRPAPGTGSCPATSAAPGASAGMQGASPLASPSLYRKVCWLTGGLRNRNPPGTPYRSRREFWGTGNLPVCSATSGAVVGVPGAKPPANSTKKLPLPQWGRGSGGWGNRLMRSRGKTGEAGRRHPSGTGKPPGQPGNTGRRHPFRHRKRTHEPAVRGTDTPAKPPTPQGINPFPPTAFQPPPAAGRR